MAFIPIHLGVKIMKNMLSELLLLILAVIIFVGVFQGTITDSIIQKGENVEQVIDGN